MIARLPRSTRANQRLSATEASIAAVAAGSIGALAATWPALSGEVPVGVLGAVVAATAALLLARSLYIAAESVGAGGGPRRLGSAVLGFGALLAIALPGAQLVAGARESRLSILGFESMNVDADVSKAFGIFLLSIAAFVAGEFLGDRFTRAGPSGFGTRLESRSVFWALLVLGAMVAIASPVGDQQQAFSVRGDIQGQGALTLLRWSLPLAVSIAVLNRHWHSRAMVLISLLLIEYIVQGGARSPLLLVGVALGLRLLDAFARSRRRLVVVLFAVALVWGSAAVTVGFSSWRGEIIRGQEASLTSQIGKAAGDPFGRLTRAGLDSLDGLILAMNADPKSVGASWTDPTKAVTGFVPHQVWPQKPDWLDNQVTEYYLGVGGGGLFLTAPGYAFVVFGGLPGVAGLLLLLGLLSGTSFRRLRLLSLPAVLLTYFLLRFLFGGGDAFDPFHVLGLWLLALFAAALAALGSWLAPAGTPDAVR